MKSRFDRWDGCLLCSAHHQMLQVLWWWGHVCVCVIGFIRVQTFEAIKYFLAHLCADFKSLLIHFWSKNYRIEDNLHLMLFFFILSCFSTVISWNPLLLPALPDLITGKTQKKGLWWTYLPFFSTWDTQNICCKWPCVFFFTSFVFTKKQICTGFLCTQTVGSVISCWPFCCSLLCFLRDLLGINETMAAQSL